MQLLFFVTVITFVIAYFKTGTQVPLSHDLNDKWQLVMSHVVNLVVSIHFAHVVPFDTNYAGVSQATGFVVDAKRGIIMTNRHVVGPGPFTGHALFSNHEEATLKPIYRDPVHDFGFLQFDPSKVKFLNLSEISINPDGAAVGTEIRVVGNDAGEKLSILSGYISRIDRNAPDYYYGYNDFNTAYIQAAASATGGSSGSPVVDINGDAVALQAGGLWGASTDFFLPLHRPLRALKLIQEGSSVPRGDLQIKWSLKPYDECRRLGLDPVYESEARKKYPDSIGMLVAENVLKNGTAYGYIREGDVLLEIDGKIFANFLETDEYLDSLVNQKVQLKIQRGEKKFTQLLPVTDIYSITPSRYVEVSGQYFSDVSYQVAMRNGWPLRGIINGETVIDSIDGKATPNLDAFIDVMNNLECDTTVNVAYRGFEEYRQNHMFRRFDRDWIDIYRIAQRNDTSGLWDFSDIPYNCTKKEIYPKSVKVQNFSISNEDGAQLSKSFVKVKTFLPLPLDSFLLSQKELEVYGLVIDAKRGYVLAHNMASDPGISISSIVFGDSVEVPAKLVFQHPTLRYIILNYDPSLVVADIQTPKFSFDKGPVRGEDVFFIGYSEEHLVVTDKTRVADVHQVKAYQNVEGIIVDLKRSGDCLFGVFLNSEGAISSVLMKPPIDSVHSRMSVSCVPNYFWSRESENYFALDISNLADLYDEITSNEKVESLRIIDVDFTMIPYILARSMNVPDKWFIRHEETGGTTSKLLMVDHVSPVINQEDSSPLQVGDIVFKIDGKLVDRLRDLEVMYRKKTLNMEVFRDGEMITLEVPTIDTSKFENRQFVSWSGAIFQSVPHQVRRKIDELALDVYLTNYVFESPFSNTELYESFITHVNDIETPDMDLFVEVIKSIGTDTYVKLQAVRFDNTPSTVTIKTDLHYFQGVEYIKVGDKWEKSPLGKIKP